MKTLIFPPEHILNCGVRYLIILTIYHYYVLLFIIVVIYLFICPVSAGDEAVDIPAGAYSEAWGQ